MMKITWLGQAGLLFEKGDVKIMIDPYLSDSVARVNPQNVRRVPVEEALFDLSPDIMIFTHDHIDHYDPETAPRFLHKQEKKMTVLCPSSVWQKARQEGGGHNYVQFNRHTEWTEKSFCFAAVKAEHSDAQAIGVIIHDLEADKRYYVTGDTLYNKTVLADLPQGIDVIFLPVNGVGNNMNMTDAARFARDCDAKAAVPLHFGLFDSLDPRDFPFENKVIPAIYQEIPV